MQATKALTNLQLELETFSYDLKESQLMEIKQLLIDYFANQITVGIDQLFEANVWGEEKIDEWAEEHMRTPYKTTK
ncbi:MAG: hypothetical protein AAF806_24940 [Bacteroidota bacterium]